MGWNRGYEKVAHLYDLFDTKPNIQFFLRYGLEAGEILDVGAGTGRIAIPLAEKGVKVFCVEPSPAMRREFAGKLSGLPQASANITVVEGDAFSFEFHRTFEAAFLSGTFDHFLDDSERLSSLNNIGRHLEPNGRVVFDVFLELMKDAPLSPAGAIRKGSTEYRRFVGGKVLPDGVRETHLVFETYSSGKLVERVHEQSLVGIIGRQRLHSVLAETDFQVRREFGNYDSSEFREGDELLIVEAVKVAH